MQCNTAASLAFHILSKTKRAFNGRCFSASESAADCPPIGQRDVC
uniref:Uncharacterized protein n=1 Tax=Anguilla anguilla TaxID=7936 RepID=A0A0E9WLD2_ANGAN